MFEPFNLSIEKTLQMPDVFRHTVSHRAFETVPNKFVRVKLRSVSRKMISKDTITGFKESFNRARFVDSTRIPQKHKASLKMLKKIFKKDQNFRVTNVLRPVKTDIKAEPSFLSRNTDCGDSRYLRPSPGDSKNWRFAFRRPCFLNSGDKTKPAFIEEDQRNSERSGLFLYGAKHNVSTVLSSFHPALWPLSRAFDNSNPSVSGTTRDGWGDTTPQSVSELPRQSFYLSRDRWSSLRSEALLKESLSTTASGASSPSSDAPEQVLTSILQNLSSDDLSAIDEQNLLNNRSYRQQPADLILALATQQPAGAAVRGTSGFHMVSWNHNSIFTGVFPLLLRMSILTYIMVMASLGQPENNTAMEAKIIKEFLLYILATPVYQV